MNRQRGGVPIPQHQRWTRVTDPALRGLVPALSVPTENANQTINKIAATLNRAGTSPRNPVLAGLAGNIQFAIDERDRLIGVFMYRDRTEPGPDLIDDVITLGENLFGLDFLIGAGTSVAGSPVTGAVRNFLQIHSRAGKTERVFWAKSYDRDVVTLAGLSCLDAALDPVEIVVNIVDASRDWIEVPVDFMVSWGDEFSVNHRRNLVDVENGNLKSYGGAMFVSFFQTGELESVGTEVNPVTKQPIASQRTMQVENTEGLKHVTVRFRSKLDSAYFVDVDVLVRVVAPDDDVCVSPLGTRCGEELLLTGAETPSDLQNTPSVEGVQDVAGVEGVPLTQDLFYLAIHGNSVSSTPVFVVERYGAVASAEDLAGFIYQLISTKEYKPLTRAAITPDPGAPYLGPKQYTVCFSKVAEELLGVVQYLVYLKDGDHFSRPTPFPGPSARDITIMPIGGTGGVDECFYG